MLNTFVQLHGRSAPHTTALLHQAVRLLEITLSRRAFQAFAERLLSAASWHACFAPLRREEYPFTSAYPQVALVSALVARSSFRQAFLKHPGEGPVASRHKRYGLGVLTWPACITYGSMPLVAAFATPLMSTVVHVHAAAVVLGCSVHSI